MRFLVLVALLAACETTTTSITRRVVSLGYARPPSVVIVRRGAPDVAERWAAKLRADKAVTVVGELHVEKVEPLRPDAKFLCGNVHAAFPDVALDEIIVLDVVQVSRSIEPCISEACDPRPLLARNTSPPNCRCIRREYRKFVTSISTKMSAIRASSCIVVATQELPTARGESSPHPPVAFSRDAEVAETRKTDEADSQRRALDALARTIEAYRWQLAPPSDATVRAVDADTVVVDDPKQHLEAGKTYWIKPPVGSMRETAQVTSVDSATATVRTSGEPIEPRDELHQTTDLRRTMVYGGLSGGTVSAQNARHGTAAAALAMRVSFKVLPMIFEARLEGDLVPGLDTARWVAGGAGGFRYQLGPFAPLAFAELGLAKAYQSGGAAAFGFQMGAGAGLELSLGKWALLVDARYRRLYLDDWEKQMPTHAYDTWSSTTFHFGVGTLF